jgi:uncharacterized damage-inducible protein DinB
MAATTPLDPLRYPVGPMPRLTGPLAPEVRARLVDGIAWAPARVRALVSGLPDDVLERRYRPGGWTIRQVVHHMADSHINAYVRMKLAATEDAPRIVAYQEAAWAELPEARLAPVALSVVLLEALHARWVAFLLALDESAFTRPFDHPKWGPVSIAEAVLWYEWHGRHHTAHIEQALR